MHTVLKVLTSESITVTTCTRRAGALLIAGVLTFVGAGCGAPSKASPEPASHAAAEPPVAGKRSEELDLATIFPAGSGRDLVLDNCQSCHTIVPIVVLQMDEHAWQTSSTSHRERVQNLTDEEFKQVYDYLPKHFGPHRPVPKLPKALLDSWTSY